MAALTFREALASRLFWATSLLTGLCVVLCLSVRVYAPPPLPTDPGEARLRLPLEEYRRHPSARAEGIDPAGSDVTLLFGAFRIQYRHDVENAVGFLQSLLAGFLAGTAGVVLVLVWTAGFLPDFLEPANATVLLGKPVPRWSLLVGKYLGVVAFVALQTALFVGGTWLALGASTGVWEPRYLWCAPILVLYFAVFFSVSVCLAVWTRRTVVCMVGVLVFWAACWSLNHNWHAWHATAPAAEVPVLVEVGYWILPKPADLSWTLFDLLDAPSHLGKVLDYRDFAVPHATPLLLSVLTSLLFAAAVLFLSAVRFARTDY